MKGLRFREVPSDRRNDEQHNIVAIYDDEARTIYLPDGWTGRSAADLSVLVREIPDCLPRSVSAIDRFHRRA
nr:hypothetical protein [Chelativorans xinjiangense]